MSGVIAFKFGIHVFYELLTCRQCS